MTGQINRGDHLGDFIYEVASDTKYKNYVEIGTWNGQGSTLCFRQGLETRDDEWSFFSFESDIDFYRQASLFHGETDPRFNLVYGRIINSEDMFQLESDLVKNHYANHVHENIHTRFFNHDLAAYESCDNRFSLIEGLDIDVLLLDGGEFSTYAEFEMLKNATGMIILDDTKELKTKAVREALMSDEEWTCLVDSGSRNGFSIHTNKKRGKQ